MLVGIVGAGIVGCVAALALESKGYQVTLFELREDPTKGDGKMKNLRSINLSLSSRGINALNLVDKSITDGILSQCVPLKGRMIHDKSGKKQESQKYGLFGEYNNSIDRGLLNKLLIEEVKRRGVRMLFNHRLVNMSNTLTPRLVFETGEADKPEFEFDYVIGCDGSHSQFKYQLQKGMRMNTTQNYIDMQYMELYIAPKTNGSSELVLDKYKIDPNHLHIWPRDNYMLIALANLDGSFTSTFFSGWSLIESIKSSAEFVDFFRKNFPDAVDLLGEAQLVEAYEKYPRGSLIQTSAYPYHSPNRKALILGDAAHLMVPFYGQGMNCGLEDVTVLLELLNGNGNDLSLAFEQYSLVRKKDLDTICKLAMDNYNEMASKVTKTSFLFRKKIDYYLGKYCNGKLGFQWVPMYSMISFRPDIAYSKAVALEARQDRILNAVQYTGITAVVVVAVAKAHQWWSRA